MNKLLTTILLASTICSAQTNEFTRFRTVKNGVVAYKAYKVIETSSLTNDAPSDCEWALSFTYDEEGNITTTNVCTLGKLVGYKRAVSDAETMIKLSACQYHTGRKLAVTEDDLRDWMSYFGSTNGWLTAAEHKEYMNALEDEQ